MMTNYCFEDGVFQLESDIAEESGPFSTLREFLEPDHVLLYPKDVNPAQLPQLQAWNHWVVPQLHEPSQAEHCLGTQKHWTEALELEFPEVAHKSTMK